MAAPPKNPYILCVVQHTTMRLLFFIIYVVILSHFIRDLFLLIRTWIINIWGNDTMSLMQYSTLQL